MYLITESVEYSAVAAMKNFISELESSLVNLNSFKKLHESGKDKEELFDNANDLFKKCKLIDNDNYNSIIGYNISRYIIYNKKSDLYNQIKNNLLLHAYITSLVKKEIKEDDITSYKISPDSNNFLKIFINDVNTVLEKAKEDTEKISKNEIRTEIFNNIEEFNNISGIIFYKKDEKISIIDSQLSKGIIPTFISLVVYNGDIDNNDIDELSDILSKTEIDKSYTAEGTINKESIMKSLLHGDPNGEAIARLDKYWYVKLHYDDYGDIKIIDVLRGGTSELKDEVTNKYNDYITVASLNVGEGTYSKDIETMNPDGTKKIETKKFANTKKWKIYNKAWSHYNHGNPYPDLTATAKGFVKYLFDHMYDPNDETVEDENGNKVSVYDLYNNKINDKSKYSKNELEIRKKGRKTVYNEVYNIAEEDFISLKKSTLYATLLARFFSLCRLINIKNPKTVFENNLNYRDTINKNISSLFKVFIKFYDDFKNELSYSIDADLSDLQVKSFEENELIKEEGKYYIKHDESNKLLIKNNDFGKLLDKIKDKEIISENNGVLKVFGMVEVNNWTFFTAYEDKTFYNYSLIKEDVKKEKVVYQTHPLKLKKSKSGAFDLYCGEIKIEENVAEDKSELSAYIKNIDKSNENAAFASEEITDLNYYLIPLCKYFTDKLFDGGFEYVDYSLNKKEEYKTGEIVEYNDNYYRIDGIDTADKKAILSPDFLINDQFITDISNKTVKEKISALNSAKSCINNSLSNFNPYDNDDDNNIIQRTISYRLDQAIKIINERFINAFSRGVPATEDEYDKYEDLVSDRKEVFKELSDSCLNTKKVINIKKFVEYNEKARVACESYKQILKALETADEYLGIDFKNEKELNRNNNGAIERSEEALKDTDKHAPLKRRPFVINNLSNLLGNNEYDTNRNMRTKVIENAEKTIFNKMIKLSSEVNKGKMIPFAKYGNNNSIIVSNDIINKLYNDDSIAYKKNMSDFIEKFKSAYTNSKIDEIKDLERSILETNKKISGLNSSLITNSNIESEKNIEKIKSEIDNNRKNLVSIATRYYMLTDNSLYLNHALKASDSIISEYESYISCITNYIKIIDEEKNVAECLEYLSDETIKNIIDDYSSNPKFDYGIFKDNNSLKSYEEKNRKNKIEKDNHDKINGEFNNIDIHGEVKFDNKKEERINISACKKNAIDNIISDLKDNKKNESYDIMLNRIIKFADTKKNKYIKSINEKNKYIKSINEKNVKKYKIDKKAKKEEFKKVISSFNDLNELNNYSRNKEDAVFDINELQELYQFITESEVISKVAEDSEKTDLKAKLNELNNKTNNKNFEDIIKAILNLFAKGLLIILENKGRYLPDALNDFDENQSKINLENDAEKNIVESLIKQGVYYVDQLLYSFNGSFRDVIECLNNTNINKQDIKDTICKITNYREYEVSQWLDGLKFRGKTYALSVLRNEEDDDSVKKDEISKVLEETYNEVIETIKNGSKYDILELDNTFDTFLKCKEDPNHVEPYNFKNALRRLFRIKWNSPFKKNSNTNSNVKYKGNKSTYRHKSYYYMYGGVSDELFNSIYEEEYDKYQFIDDLEK